METGYAAQVEAAQIHAAEQGRASHRAWLIRISLLIICYLLLLLYTVRWTRDAFGYTWDFSIYYNKTLAAQAGQSPYFPYFVSTSFLYHPAVLSFLSLFTLISEPTAYYIWTAASLAAYAVSAGLIFRLYAGDHQLPREKIIFVIVLLAGFGPLWEATHLGQINAFVTLCLALSLYFSERERPVLSGLCLGLAIVLKLSPATFILYFLVLRRYRVIVAAVVAVIGLSVLAYVQFGPGVFADFLSILPRLAGETNAGHLLNLSAPIVTSRILELFQITNAESGVAFAYKIVFGIGIAALVIYAARRQQSRMARLWLFAILTVLMTMVSPVVWFHHEIFLIIPLTLLLVDRFGWALAIMLLLQSERLIYNVTVSAVGLATENVTAAIALTDGVPTLLAQLALLATLVWIYRKTTISHMEMQPAAITATT